MKKLIKYALNHLPRKQLQRVAHWVVPVVGLLYVGRGVECPVCGARRRRFMPYGYGSVRPNALCPRCLSLERHRMMWLWLKNETDFFERKPRTLHIAPERCFIKRFERLLHDDYVTADLESPLAKVKLDVQQMPFADASFDVVFCNHIMEHVADDRRALAEIRRVLRPGGWGIVMAPVNMALESTHEDPSITTPEGRAAAFGQHDHVREYGRDYHERLAEAGFAVEVVAYHPDTARYGLSDEPLYIVRSYHNHLS